MINRIIYIYRNHFRIFLSMFETNEIELDKIQGFSSWLIWEDTWTRETARFELL